MESDSFAYMYFRIEFPYPSWVHLSTQNIYFNPYKPRVFFVGHRQNTADPDQTPQNAASDQGLHSFLAGCSFKILEKTKINTVKT